MSKAGEFFAVDRRSWADVCDLGSVNAAVAYLVLARGTLKDQRTSSWSVHSIEGRTGVARPRAIAAVASLIEAGLLTKTRGGSRPGYRIEIAAEEPDWIWLPNSIIDGAAKETSPVERLRQTQNLGTLRLYVDLYHAQDLAADGGVNWRLLRVEYERRRIGEQGPYVVWGFWPGNYNASHAAPFVSPFLTGRRETYTRSDGTEYEADPGGHDFNESVRTLRDLGLIEFVAHLVEADTSEASVIHPLPMRAGETAEQQLGQAAHEAGLALLSDAQVAWVEANQCILVPVLKHISEATIVGLLRHRYRAKTAATAKWHSRTVRWESLTAGYRELRQEALSLQRHATSMEIKGHQR